MKLVATLLLVPSTVAAWCTPPYEGCHVPTAAELAAIFDEPHAGTFTDLTTGLGPHAEQLADSFAQLTGGYIEGKSLSFFLRTSDPEPEGYVTLYGMYITFRIPYGPWEFELFVQQTVDVFTAELYNAGTPYVPAIPEPSTYALMLLGLGALAWRPLGCRRVRATHLSS